MDKRENLGNLGCHPDLPPLIDPVLMCVVMRKLVKRGFGVVLHFAFLGSVTKPTSGCECDVLEDFFAQLCTQWVPVCCYDKGYCSNSILVKLLVENLSP